MPHTWRRTLTAASTPDAASLFGLALGKLMRSSGGRVARGAVLSLSIKVMSAGLTLVIFSLASHAMDMEAFGRLSIWFNALSFAAVFTVFGQDNLIVRSWSEYRVSGSPGLARGAYFHGWAVVAATSAVTVTVTAIVATYGIGAPPSVVAAGSAFLAAQTFTHYSSHSCRLICPQLLADGNRELPWRLFILIVVLAFMASRRAFTIEAFFWSAAAGMVTAVLCQSFAVAARFPEDIRLARAERRSRRWLATAIGLWFPAVLEAASQYAEVVLIGVLLNPVAAAGYFVAMRFANVFPMIATGLNAYVLNRVAGYHFEGRRAEMMRMFRPILLVGSSLTLSLLLVIIAAGPWLLSFFGPRYVHEYPTLLVLSLGTASVTLAGPTAVSLLTTGNERIYSVAVTIAMIARFVLMAVLVPRYGAFGAAAAWTLSSLPLAAVLVKACRLQLGVDPSVLGLLRQPVAAIADRG